MVNTGIAVKLRFYVGVISFRWLIRFRVDILFGFDYIGGFRLGYLWRFRWILVELWVYEREIDNKIL